jgi:hypothetical protein
MSRAGAEIVDKLGSEPRKNEPALLHCVYIEGQKCKEKMSLQTAYHKIFKLKAQGTPYMLI